MALVERLLWHVEMQLSRPVTLTGLARLCAASPYHMLRVFRDATGLSPIAYLRARRLSEAAKALATGTDDILTIALDAQYTSHEAFTRAFAAYHLCSPKEVRAAGTTSNLTLMEPLKMDKNLIVDTQPPAFRDRPAFRVTGLAATCTRDTIDRIPSLWRDFNARAGDLDGTTERAAMGVCYDADETGAFRYLAGAPVAADAAIPTGMEQVSIPANHYAVFTHSGSISDLPKTVYTIWNKALPDLGLTPVPAPDFELYDRRFDPETGRGEVEIWIPVQP